MCTRLLRCGAGRARVQRVRSVWRLALTLARTVVRCVAPQDVLRAAYTAPECMHTCALRCANVCSIAAALDA